MNLKNKKDLAKRVLKVGKGRIVFIEDRISEIKEAMTKQDIRDLKEQNAIVIKDVKGRKKKINKKKNKGPGKIRKKVNKSKRNYVLLTRKLRKYLKEMKKQGKISKEEFKDTRKKIRNKKFRSKAHLKSKIKGEKIWKKKIVKIWLAQNTED